MQFDPKSFKNSSNFSGNNERLDSKSFEPVGGNFDDDVMTSRPLATDPTNKNYGIRDDDKPKTPTTPVIQRKKFADEEEEYGKGQHLKDEIL